MQLNVEIMSEREKKKENGYKGEEACQLSVTMYVIMGVVKSGEVIMNDDNSLVLPQLFTIKYRTML